MFIYLFLAQGYKSPSGEKLCAGSFYTEAFGCQSVSVSLNLWTVGTQSQAIACTFGHLYFRGLHQDAEGQNVHKQMSILRG